MRDVSIYPSLYLTWSHTYIQIAYLLLVRCNYKIYRLEEVLRKNLYQDFSTQEGSDFYANEIIFHNWAATSFILHKIVL